MNLPHVPEAFVRAMHHWDRRRNAATGDALLNGVPTHCTIALSREVGARGTTVAREVGRRLGWHVYDHELLEVIARELQVRVELLESIDERHVNWLEEQVEQFAKVPHVTADKYVYHLVQALFALAIHGECIIVGRGAAQILPASSTLRVRLIGTIDDRTATMCELGLDRSEAHRRVAAIDSERAKFVRDHFHRDPADPREYDLLLNTSRVSSDACAEMIVVALRQLEAQRAAAAMVVPAVNV